MMLLKLCLLALGRVVCTVAAHYHGCSLAPASPLLRRQRWVMVLLLLLLLVSKLIAKDPLAWERVLLSLNVLKLLLRLLLCLNLSELVELLLCRITTHRWFVKGIWSALFWQAWNYRAHPRIVDSRWVDVLLYLMLELRLRLRQLLVMVTFQSFLWLCRYPRRTS